MFSVPTITARWNILLSTKILWDMVNATSSWAVDINLFFIAAIQLDRYYNYFFGDFNIKVI